MLKPVQDEVDGNSNSSNSGCTRCNYVIYPMVNAQ